MRPSYLPTLEGALRAASAFLAALPLPRPAGALRGAGGGLAAGVRAAAAGTTAGVLWERAGCAASVAASGLGAAA